MILALQVRVGLPPFYKSMAGFWDWDVLKEDKDFERAGMRALASPIIFWLPVAIVLAVATGWSILFAFAAVGSIWAGIQVRKDLLQTIGGPMPWLINIWTVNRPLLVFDVWTITLSTLSVILLLLLTK